MQDALDFLARERCSAILRTTHAEAVEPAMQAAVGAGFRVVEFTLTTPGALAAVAKFRENPELLVGAGTVLTVEQAQESVAAGAQFLVSPVVDREVISWAVENQVLIIPGTFTPTEMRAAHDAGAQIVKLFPGPADGPDYVKACLGPMPFLRIFPTSGVTEDNVQDYLRAGAFGVGFVGCLFHAEDMAHGNYLGVRERAQRMVQLVREATDLS
ncbi:MAG: bifunctional 4-hydroxy-2-oxoglutarate aldolase/2-dehydro-3-deoxy-phosphogluconate aldolase [Planctomycetota bacterium]|jgi:Entner-Doudoroff aldolase